LVPEIEWWRGSGGREVYRRQEKKGGEGSGIPKVARSRRKRAKLCNIAQYFVIEKKKRGGSQQIQ